MSFNLTCLGACALALLALGNARAQATPVACDAASFQTVLQRSSDRHDARAVWLNAQLAQWPGSSASGTFKLYYSASGAIDARRGARVHGADGALALDLSHASVPAAVAARFRYLQAGALLAVRAADQSKLAGLHRGQLLLVRQDRAGIVQDVSALQVAGALDDLYASAANAEALGVHVDQRGASFALWAPNAQRVQLCSYASGTARATSATPMRFDSTSGVWSLSAPATQSGSYYTYLVDVFVNGHGVVRNRVTDPYSISLSTDSLRSYVGNLDAPALKPADWDNVATPDKVKAQTDMVVYELHVRDFSINDASVSAANRGKYAAFTETGSNGMRHLAALARAGMTDIHLLPIFDFASVPERACATPKPSGSADGDSQQALISATRETDCFNWGYDPYHYSAPEGSYSNDPMDGARRVLEVRQMVTALHKLGLRVGMDVVYNHTFTGGQQQQSVLDRIVPGYYHRLDARGAIERSTCCDNTATENLMMEKLMIDSVAQWASAYRIDSFRFDLMGHQPRAAMQRLQVRVNAAAGRPVQLIGEGWNFGEVADGARFVQASQNSLGGSGIGTFSDRARDVVRGGAASDAGAALQARQGFINGLVLDPNGHAGARPVAELLDAGDMIKLGLAGSIRSYPLITHSGAVKTLDAIDYNGQPAGYASEPGEVVNYVENHDNQTLFDINVFKLPLATSSVERARVQMLGAAINAFSQGVAYFHAGIDTLRSKSLDRNSFNSGDWFNRIDWTYQDNYFGTGAPPREDNGGDYAIIKPLLANAAIKPTPADIGFARDVFRDLLAIRASSTLFRLRSAADIKQRLQFFNVGPDQQPGVIAAKLDGDGYPGAGYTRLVYLINVDKVAHTIKGDAGRRYHLHPVQAAPGGADRRAASASYDGAAGSFNVPARSAVVFVE